MSDMQDDNSVTLTFDYDMQQSVIGLNDISVSVSSDILVKFDWTAVYSDLRTLVISFNIYSALQGGEELTIKLNNYKVFRSPTGG